MHLFLSIEAQNATDIGLAKILNDVTQTLKFITAKDENLEDYPYRVNSQQIYESYWRLVK